MWLWTIDIGLVYLLSLRFGKFVWYLEKWAVYLVFVFSKIEPWLSKMFSISFRSLNYYFFSTIILQFIYNPWVPLTVCLSFYATVYIINSCAIPPDTHRPNVLFMRFKIRILSHARYTSKPSSAPSNRSSYSRNVIYLSTRVRVCVSSRVVIGTDPPVLHTTPREVHTHAQYIYIYLFKSIPIFPTEWRHDGGSGGGILYSIRSGSSGCPW